MSRKTVTLLEPATTDQANIGEIHSCWHKFPKWDDSRVATIKDAVGANEDRQITSYPSPIARMHLFNDAFKFHKDEDSKTREEPSIYSKLISQCLDTWEILFYHDIFREKIKIKSWSFNEIDSLLVQSQDGHRLLGKGLELFIREDKNPLLQNCSSIVLLIYDGLPIAGSSPFTGFFTSSELSDVHLSIPGNAKGKYFQETRHLHERDIEFQKYLHTLARIENFYKYFQDFYAYIKSFERSNDIVKKIWQDEEPMKTVKERFQTDYDPIRIPHTIRLLDNSETGGFELRSFRPSIEENCYFIIKSSVYTGVMPLALKKYPEGPKKKSYVKGSAWDDKYEVPLNLREQELARRKLPGVNIEYPFITIGDLFEDYLIRLPYDINDEAFLTCTLEKKPSPYLLPLKPLIFQFFTIEEIQKNFTLEFIDSLKLKVRATLSIPLQNKQSIIFSRDYDFLEDPVDVPTPAEIEKMNENRGYIINTYRLGLWIFPLIKSGKPVYDNFYRVGLVDDESSTTVAAQLTFYQKGKPLGDGNAPISRQTRVEKQDFKAGSYYYGLEFDPEENHSIDTIGVTIDLSGLTKVSAVIIPKWFKVTTDSEYTYEFSVDFGTTNTHVAYRRSNNLSKGLDIGLTDNFYQVARLDKFSILSRDSGNSSIPPIVRKTNERQLQEFIPSEIGKKYRFPLRTALSMATGVRVAAQAEVLTNSNILFAMMDSLKDQDNHIYTDLKWGRKKDNDTTDLPRERIKIFIKQLLYMIRTKVLLNGGNPATTTIYWFRPLSMSLAFTRRLEEVWRDEYKKIFNTDLELIESSLWSDRYNGYEMIINELKTSEDGFEVFKSNNVDIPSILEEPHDLATRKAYKLVSIYIRIEEDTEMIKSLYFKL